MNEPPRLDEARLHLDTLQQTLREGLHAMNPASPEPSVAGYAGYLQSVRNRLRDVNLADLRRNPHPVIAEILDAALRDVNKERRRGALEAQAFLLGFVDGTCSGCHANGLSSRRHIDGRALLWAVEDHSKHVQKVSGKQPGPVAHALEVLSHELGEVAHQCRTALNATPAHIGLHETRRLLYRTLETTAQGLRGELPPGEEADGWGFTCQLAHVRLRAFVSGFVMSLEFAHAPTSLSTWEQAARTGRPPVEAFDHPNAWWAQHAHFILGELRSRSYWRPPRVEAPSQQAWDNLAALCTLAIDGPDDLRGAVERLVVSDPVARRLHAWLLGALEGKAAATPLETLEAKAWLNALREARPSLAPDVDATFAAEPRADDEPDALFQAFHAVKDSFLARGKHDGVLPADPEACRAIGFVMGHHRFSLFGDDCPHDQH